jgi:hypothetical protein
MVAPMNRSPDLMTGHARRSGNRFVMDRRGQVYATARPEVAEALDRRGHEAAELGASMLRVAISARDYVSAAAQGVGADPPDLIRNRFGDLNPDTVATPTRPTARYWRPGACCDRSEASGFARWFRVWEVSRLRPERRRAARFAPAPADQRTQSAKPRAR